MFPHAVQGSTSTFTQNTGTRIVQQVF